MVHSRSTMYFPTYLCAPPLLPPPLKKSLWASSIGPCLAQLDNRWIGLDWFPKTTPAFIDHWGVQCGDGRCSRSGHSKCSLRRSQGTWTVRNTRNAFFFCITIAKFKDVQIRLNLNCSEHNVSHQSIWFAYFRMMQEALKFEIILQVNHVTQIK